MELNCLYFVTFGLLLVILIFRSCWNLKKKCSGFPFSHILPHLIYSHISGKISKDNPFCKVFFQKLIQTGKEHMKEGLFMTYISGPMLFIFNEEAIKMLANEKAAVDKSSDYKFLKEFMGDGLITSNGQRWRKHRKMINPVFHMGVLKEKVPIFNEHAMALVKDMEELAVKPSVDLLKTLKCHYFYALSESVLGVKQNKENEAEFQRMGEIVDSLTAFTINKIFYPLLRPKFILQCFPFGRQFYQQIKEIDDYITKVIFEMKEYIYSDRNMDEERFSVHLRKSFTYILLDRHVNDPSFTFKDLHSEVKTMIGAGYDTVSFTTMCCLFLLGLHPEIQEKALNEILSATSDYITYEESSNLVYLESVIMETMRIYPTVPMIGRHISEDIQFGKNYALIEMKIFLSHILRNFQITSLDRREDVDLCCGVVLAPVRPLRMKITPRHYASL